jgi:hypothetical protein
LPDTVAQRLPLPLPDERLQVVPSTRLHDTNPPPARPATRGIGSA